MSELDDPKEYWRTANLAAVEERRSMEEYARAQQRRYIMPAMGELKPEWYSIDPIEPLEQTGVFDE